MITSTFTTFDIIITSIREHEMIGIVFILIPILGSSCYWASLSRKNILRSSLFCMSVTVLRPGKIIKSAGAGIFTAYFLIFIFSINVFSLLPLTLPVSSHISLTLRWSLPLWFSLIFIGFKTPRDVLRHIVPASTGGLLGPFLAIIEFISSTIRPLSLSFRIAANITAGHVIMGLASSAFGPLVSQGILAPLLVGIAYTLFESLVCIIQAYVFVLLIVIYSNDY